MSRLGTCRSAVVAARQTGSVCRVPRPDPTRLAPSLARLRRYERSWLRYDVLAGVTVAAYLVPQVMAYAEVAGLPAVVGLWAIVGPLLVYAVLGSSRQLSVGPESTTALMTAAAVGAARGRRPGPVRRPRGGSVPRGRRVLRRSAGSGGSASWPTCCPSPCWSATWPASP